MSTSPESNRRADDRLVGYLSEWLARHIDGHELLQRVEAVGTHELDGEQAQAVDELREALQAGRDGGELEMVVRETLEALALGG